MSPRVLVVLVMLCAAGPGWAAPPAGRAESGPHDGILTVGAGERVEIEVAPYERVLSFDSARVEVEPRPPDRLAISANATPGTTTVHLIGPEGLQVLVVEVVPRGLLPEDPLTATGDTWVRTGVLVAGTGAALGTTSLIAEVGSRGITGPGSTLRGQLALAVAEQPRFLGATLRLDDPRWRATLGRSFWALAENAGTAPMDVAAFEWGRSGEWRVGGMLGRLGTASWTDPAPAGGEVSVGLPRLGPVHGYARVFGWSDPDLGLQAGGALGARVAHADLEARGEAFWSGAGGGGSLALTATPGGFRVRLDGAARSKGGYLPGSDVGPGARLGASFGYSAGRWAVDLNGAGARYAGADGGRREFASVGVQGTFRPTAPTTLTAGWMAFPSRFTSADDGTTARGEHWTTLMVLHQTSPLRVGATARLRLPLGEEGMPALDLRADSLWRVRGGWTPNVTASASFGLSEPHYNLNFRGGLDYGAETWSGRVFAGLGVNQGIALTLEPMVGGFGEARFHPVHALGVSGWAGFPTKRTPNWQAQLHYTVRPRRRAPPASGSKGRLVGRVFEDRDLDGVRDPGEQPVVGTRVLVGGLDVATTNERGEFVARGVPLGSAGVRAMGGGWIPADPIQVEVTGGGAHRVEIPARSASRVTAVPFLDVDTDGVHDADEPIVRFSKARVVGDDGAEVASADAARGFAVFGLPTGSLRLVLDMADAPAGYVPIGPLEAPFEATPGSSFTAAFPFRALHAVGGRVRVDHNGNGVPDNGDPGAAGVVVRCDGQSVTTDAQGNFLFRDLPQGGFVVETEGGLQRPEVHFGAGPREWLGVEIALPGQGTVAPTSRPAPTPVGVPEFSALRAETDRVPLAPGADRQLSLFAGWSDGTWRDVATEASWTTGDPAVATVEAGRLRGVGEGRTEVTASWQGREARLVVDVAAVPFVGLLLSSTRLELAVGATGPLTVRGILTTGTIEDATARVEWTTSDPTVATVAPDGTVTAVGPGTCEIGASLRGVQAFPARVTVTK